MYRFYPSKGFKNHRKLAYQFKFETSKENQYLSICRPKTEELKRKYVSISGHKINLQTDPTDIKNLFISKISAFLQY